MIKDPSTDVRYMFASDVGKMVKKIGKKLTRCEKYVDEKYMIQM